MGAALAPIAIGAQVLGTAVSGFGAYSSGQASAANAAYQAQVAANNAIVARQNAAMERQSGEIAAGNQSMKTRAVVGKIEAGQAASGVELNTGSSVRVRKAAVELGTLDALTIRSDAAKRAWAYDTQASNYTAQSELLKVQGEQAKSAGMLSAFASLLSGASSVAGKWSNYGNVSGSYTGTSDPTKPGTLY